MEILTEIEINFTDRDPEFFENLTGFLNFNPYVASSNSDLLPKIKVNQLPKKHLSVNFCTDFECINVEVKNDTDKIWKSKYDYKYLSYEEFYTRLKQENIINIDHLGVNFPYISGEIHPKILDLREMLKNKSLYHLFPTGEPWDFILPGYKEEIQGKQVDYELERKPKFEIVSFDTCSTPLVQIDAVTNLKYNELKERFPEALYLDEIKSLWVYFKTKYDFDVCLVLNELGKGWTRYFKSSRLT